ncbi:pentatricopeptide repeat-containing protein [Dorcoceras hygrometricum]|uniref:Pentatricopeptide repeat-containing protein n=1 Tax=Dorcoceras hygrometricum TaxID=472368 RepID=A0A2Z7CXH6_9LAMI|nr:pentatricopeptide repeat-containing protein [Dorcoceras hygrometricum]
MSMKLSSVGTTETRTFQLSSTSIFLSYRPPNWYEVKALGQMLPAPAPLLKTSRPNSRNRNEKFLQFGSNFGSVSAHACSSASTTIQLSPDQLLGCCSALAYPSVRKLHSALGYYSSSGEVTSIVSPTAQASALYTAGTKISTCTRTDQLTGPHLALTKTVRTTPCARNSRAGPKPGTAHSIHSSTVRNNSPDYALDKLGVLDSSLQSWNLQQLSSSLITTTNSFLS